MLNSLFDSQRIEPTFTTEVSKDDRTSRLSLYGYESCSFCVKVRRVMKQLNLDIEMRDTLNNVSYREELQREGGKAMVPCLRIAGKNGKVYWLYESSKIIRFLQDNFLKKISN